MFFLHTLGIVDIPKIAGEILWRMLGSKVASCNQLAARFSPGQVAGTSAGAALGHWQDRTQLLLSQPPYPHPQPHSQRHSTV